MKSIHIFCLAAGLATMGTAPAMSLPAVTQAYASGSTSVVLMNGASQSLGAEIAAPAGAIFTNTVGLNPTLSNPGAAATADTGLASNNNSYTSFAVAPGALAAANPASTTSVEAAVATQINGAASVADGVSYTRAWQSGLQ